jgi:hypothetical protein
MPADLALYMIGQKSEVDRGARHYGKMASVLSVDGRSETHHSDFTDDRWCL